MSVVYIYYYEKGKHSIVPILYNAKDESLSIGKRNGEFEGMLRGGKFIIVAVSKTNPGTFDFSEEGQVVNFDGSLQTIKLK